MTSDGDEVPEELAKSLTIGWSQNDARLYLLLEDGGVVEWFYHEPPVQGIAASQLLYNHLHLKQWKPAIAVIPRFRSLAKQVPGILHNAACIYARAGDPKRALECIAEAKRRKYDMKKLRDDDDFESLHALPAWKRLFR
jgi:hypothetical protein